MLHDATFRLKAQPQNLRGIIAMLGVVAMFALMDTAMKLLSDHYPAIQVAAMRGMSALPLLGAAIIVASGVYLIRREETHCEAEHP